MKRFVKESSLSLFFLGIFLLALLGQAVMENWQSEYLQFALFALVTAWLLQKGSSESKELEKAGTESAPRSRRSASTPKRALRRGSALAACGPRSTPTS